MTLKRQLSLFLSLAVCLIPNSLQINSASAQEITSDGTTGTTVTSDGNNYTIEDGTRNGGNLFHSFQDFSVPNGGSAFFNNGNDISNILSRVTGGNISNIDGLIRANGSANLFLINPAGIMFGEGASLAIGGSFYGSTADSILFEDGEFSAVNNLDAPILTINAPIGLNFRDNPGDIVTNENPTDTANLSLLEVAEDQSINLVGGDIDLNNTILFAPGGNVELGGLQASGTIALNENGDLSFPENIARGNISLDNSQVFADFSDDGEGGSINLNANNIEFINASFLQTGINANLGFADAQAGDITLNATEKIDISGGEGIFNRVSAGGTGNAGNINITANSLAFSQAQINSNTFGQGDAGSILINVNGTAEFVNSDIFSQVGVDQEGNPGIGDGGTITVNTTNLSLLDGSQITAGVFGEGNAGNVIVNADDTITFQGIGSDGFASGILNNVASGGVGNAGNIEVTTANLNLIDGAAINSNARGQGNSGGVEITTDNLNLTNGSTVSSSTFGQGNAGTVDINASGTISIDGIDQEGSSSQIASRVESGAVGDAGGVEITTANLNLTNGGTVAASTFAQGNAGTVTIDATDTISIDGEDPSDDVTNGGIFSNVQGEAIGDAGGVEITTANLNLTNGGIVAASTFAQGNAGTVTINATDTISIDGIDQEGFESSIESNVNADAVGDAGGVNINAFNLSVTNGGTISASTTGQGNAGTIDINVTDTISIDGEDQEGFFTGIDGSVNVGAIGDADGVEITTGNLNLINGGTISASTFGEGNAGTVGITANQTISIDGEDPGDAETVGGIFSNVQGEAVGNAGGVEISTANLNLTNGGTVAASTFAQGNAGTVTIDAADTISVEGEDSEGTNSFIASNVSSGAIGNAGGVEITTANLIVANGGTVAASTFAQGNAGTVIINASDTISIDGEDSEGTNSQISSAVENGAVGNAGGVNLTTANLNLANGGTVSASTFAQGNAGTVIINASDTISIDGEEPSNDETVGGIFSNVSSSAVGDAGGVEITTTNLNLTNGGTVAASTFGEGNAGTVTIDAADTISVEGEDQEGFNSFIASNVSSGAIGNAGGVEITTANLIVANGGTVSANTSAQGNAGTVIINASDTISVDGEDSEGTNSGISSRVNAGAVGDAGGVEITTDNLNLTNGGTVSATTFAQGNAGTVTIDASDTISVDGEDPSDDLTNGGIFSNVQGEAVGDAGGVNITTANLNITNGGIVAASTFAQGNAGTVTINATDNIFIAGIDQEGVSSSIESNINSGAVGEAGGVNITTPNLVISDSARIVANAFGEGNGGNITLSISDRLTLQENGTISVQASATNANGGDISINAADGFVVAFPNKTDGDGSDIAAFSSEGAGGNITIEAQGIFGIEERNAIAGNNTNDIDASGDIDDGSVEIITPNSDAIQAANQLPSVPVEAGETVVQACSSQRGIANSSFVIRGKGGVPNEPGSMLSSETINTEGDAVSESASEDIQAISTSEGEIVLARGVKVNQDGGITLTAYRTEKGLRNAQKSTDCN